MNGTDISLLIGIATSIIANEFCDYLGSLAQALAKWSARRRYASRPDRARVRAEELAAVVGARPGNLLKLLTALSFAVAALAVTPRRGSLAAGELSAVRRPSKVWNSLDIDAQHALWLLAQGRLLTAPAWLVKAVADNSEVTVRTLVESRLLLQDPAAETYSLAPTVEAFLLAQRPPREVRAAR